MKLVMLFGLFVAMTAPSPPPHFEFDGLKAGEQTTSESGPLQNANCSKRHRGKVVCRKVLSKVGGISVRGSLVTLKDGKLHKLFFAGDHSDHKRIREIVVARYGKPCGGAHTLNAEKVREGISTRTEKWCFATGTLHLSNRRYLSDQFGFEYLDDR